MFFIGADVLCAQSIRIKGHVYDRETGEPIANVRITIDNGGQAHHTAADGSYQFELPSKEEVVLTVEKTGYRPIQQRMFMVADSLVYIRNFWLRPLLYEMGVVEVLAEAQKTTVPSASYHVSRKDMETTIRFAEADALRSIRYLPSNVQQNEFSALPIIRGGEPYQQLILLDDVPLYNPFHIGGTFSIIDPDIIRSVEVYASAYPPIYGGVASSVVSMRSQTIPQDSATLKGSLGIISSKVSLFTKVGPGALTVSGRRTYFDLISKLIVGARFPYYFYDIYGKYGLPLGGDHFLTTSFLFTRDKFDVYENNQSAVEVYQAPHWGNLLGSIQWMWMASSSALVTFMAYRTTADLYGLGSSIVEHDFFSIDNNTTESGFKGKLDLNFGDHSASLGADFSGVDVSSHWNINSRYLQDYSATPQSIFFDFAPAKFDSQQSRNTLSLYAIGKLSLFTGFNTSLGARFTRLSDQNNWISSPYVRAEYSLPTTLSLFVAYGRYYQSFITLNEKQRHSLFSAFAIPFFPENGRIPMAQHFSVGSSLNLPQISCDINGELYFLRKNDLPVISEIDRTTKFFIETITGFDLFARYHDVQLTATVGYSYARAVRENAGLQFPGNYDVRHSLKMTGRYALSTAMVVSLNWFINSGMPFTEPTALFLGGPDGSSDRYFTPPTPSRPTISVRPIYTTYNNRRTSAYNRLDFSLTYYVQWGGLSLRPYLTIFNLMNSNNTMILGYNAREYQYEYPSERVEIPGIPRMPLIGVDLEF